MRIKKIELIGFKSFADRTEIHLNQGVTCIVGPNGCGKSNISDALRWVFGERSAKMLRGSRMEDVIFSGTEFRKPLGMAEVSLTLDNRDHLLPIGYEEVVITRRLSRSGQSEYFINRTACRLKDILDLILDTGMGSNSYSMIEQGRVDSVINADPLERRFLIEEAAGISKYKVKKEEALRKLERTEQNLLRIRDIVSEVQKNIQYAEKQAKRAERYKTQFDELKKLEIQKAFIDLDALLQEKNEKERRKTELGDSQKVLEQDLDKIHQTERQEKEILQSILSNETAQSSHFFDVRSQVQSLIQKREFNQERFQSFEHRLIEIKKEKEILNSQLVQLEKEIQNKAEECMRFEKDHQVALGVFENEKGHFEKSESEFQTKKLESENVKASVFERASEATRVKNEAIHLKSLIERMEHEQTRRRDTIKKLQIERKNFEERRLRHQEEILNTEKVRRGGESELEGTLKTLTGLKTRIQNLDREIDEKRLRQREVLSRIELLTELHETSEVSERKLLSSIAGTKLQGKLIKSLRDVLQIKSGYESAIETVLGSLAQSLITEDVETAKGLISEMAASHMGPCGIFIQSLIPRQRSEKRTVSREVKHRAISEVVTIQQGFEPLFERLFEKVYVVEGFTTSLLEELLPQTHEIRFVTKEGILLGPEARIVFRNGRLLPEYSPFKRRAEIEELKKLNEKIAGEVQLLDQTKNKIEGEATSLDEKRNSIETKGRDHLIRGEATESLLRGLEERMSAITEEIQVLESEESEAQKEVLLKKELLTDLNKKICSAENEEKESEVRQQEINQELEKLQFERENRIHAFSRLKTLLENHEIRLNTIKEGEALLKSQAKNTKDRLCHLDIESEEASKRMDEIKTQESAQAEELEKLAESQQNAENALTTIRGRKAFQEEKHHDLLNQSRQIEDKLKEIRQELHQEDMKIMEFTYREKSIFDRMEQTYHVKMSEQERSAPERLEDLTSLEEEIQSLKIKVDAFGPVNLLAVDEFEELKQRYEFLASQEKDLCEARESLLEAIRKINRTTKTLFSDTFIKAQALFQEYYQTLFGGGHAELILIPSEEDEEGVDIMVRPPGKKLQHISLLSGGEKALTAVALLFALFKIRPSPLCVLDEVDAPLDEANVDRFLSVLRTFLDNTQFLIVTHNRKTIAMGDFLYGVTMEEFGVSKIVSVKVAQTQEKEKQVVQAV